MSDKKPNAIKISKPERLFNLTCALLYTRSGLTKNEILRSVPGYEGEYDEGGDNSSLERKFERDKASLLHNGIQLEVAIPAHEDENNQVTVYSIKRESFYWPKNVKFTPRQMALLNLAAEAWVGGSLSTAASRGITKLRAMGSIGEDSDIVGIAPRIQASDPSFRDVNNAISDHQVVNFDYRNPKTGDILTRTLQPWLLRKVAGQWLVMGFDELRNEPRNFMLRRIVSKVATAKPSRNFSPPSIEQIAKTVAELDALAEKQVAKIQVNRDSEAWFRYELDLQGNGSSDELSINYHDIYVLAEELREYAGEIRVLKPEALIQLVRAGFEKVANDHA
ncbi:MAG: WYL domain-containing protein [Rhodoluna sp.]|nr:WYL domain-containing protein [Rhodoluna sp.]